MLRKEFNEGVIGDAEAVEKGQQDNLPSWGSMEPGSSMPLPVCALPARMRLVTNRG